MNQENQNGIKQEILQGRRFAFGKNWEQFLHLLNDQRITEAERSLSKMLAVDSLQGMTFLDIGSGSGLFSLAARRLGATVFSFDYDPTSVACAEKLRHDFYGEDPQWIIKQGSILDIEFIRSLGTFDIVYSWGVLHHTGAMWKALEQVMIPVKPGGKLFIAIYNDQGWKSTAWKHIKRTYCQLPPFLRPLLLYPLFFHLWRSRIFHGLLHRNLSTVWKNYSQDRGMSPMKDVVDWIGGYPFEVAKPQDILTFFQQHKFTLLRQKTVGTGLGNNEFVFQRP